MNNITKNYNLYLEPYYDEFMKEYYHIISINKEPEGPLKNYIIKFSKKNPSTKINNLIDTVCIYAISSKISNNISKLNICTLENLSDIYEFIINNNYTINNRMINILNSDNLKINNSKKLLLSINYLT